MTVAFTQGLYFLNCVLQFNYQIQAVMLVYLILGSCNKKQWLLIPEE